MNNTFFTSDLHLFHNNILKFEPISRPFKNIDEMHDRIINNWNSLIDKDDTIFIIGDVSFGKLNETLEILNILNGKKILIIGNHDKKLMREDKFRNCFIKTYDYYVYRNEHKHYILSHYPFYTWDGNHYGSINLFGHVHSKFIGNSQQLNVGMDCHNLTPIDINQINEKLNGLIEYNINEYRME